MKRICLFCKYMIFYTGCPGYSEMTPGLDAEICCSKNHWDVDMMNDDTESYRKKLMTAEECKDYDKIDDV